MPGRALTESQKLEVLDRLYKLWMCNKELRFSQMIGNVYAEINKQLYYVEDFELVATLEAFYSKKK